MQTVFTPNIIPTKCAEQSNVNKTRILWKDTSHLNCAFTLRAKKKHQIATYLVKIHWVVHKIMSVLYFSLFLVMEILALRQNWTHKQEVGHCDLILQPIFFFNLISIARSHLCFIQNISQIYHVILEKKLILYVLLFLALVATLDSRPRGLLSF